MRTGETPRRWSCDGGIALLLQRWKAEKSWIGTYHDWISCARVQCLTCHDQQAAVEGTVVLGDSVTGRKTAASGMVRNSGAEAGQCMPARLASAASTAMMQRVLLSIWRQSSNA